MSHRLQAEVLVVGAGPAGAVCALALARLGRDVLVCEAAAFPRPHVGVSLTPGVARQLGFLGLEPILDDRRHPGAAPMQRRWSGREVEAVSHLTAFIADRGQLDRDLLGAAAKAGARVLQPACVGRPAREAQGWAVPVRWCDKTVMVEARFVIDAAGRTSPSRRRRRLGAPTVALCGLWRGASLPAVQIASAPDGWVWCAPAGPGERHALMFTDPAHLHGHSGSLAERYVQLLGQAGVSVAGLTLEGDVLAREATPFLAQGWTEDFLRIGDADAALDPLSSSGVQAAIQSALAAAPVVNTLLSNGDHAAARQFWVARRAQRAEAHWAWSSALYHEAMVFHGTPFWAQRSAPAPVGPEPWAEPPLPEPTQPLELDPGVDFIEAPCLVGDTVERRPCVTHPALAEPLGYLGDQSAVSLLSALTRGVRALDLLASWSPRVPPNEALRLLEWLWRRRLIRSAAPADDAA